jgi:Ca2+-binding RTX toxin-like protein
MSNLTLFQSYDVPQPVTTWTGATVIDRDTTQLSFHSGALRLDLNGITSVDQDGHATGLFVTDIVLSNDTGQVYKIDQLPRQFMYASDIVPAILDGTYESKLLPLLLAVTATHVIGSPGDDVVATGWSADNIDMGAGNDNINAGGGDDIIVAGPGSDVIDGNAGFDKAIWSGNLADYRITHSGDLFLVTDVKAGSTDIVRNVERLEFADKFVASDVLPDSAGGQVFRMYQAAFDRAPDPSGLLYWTFLVHDRDLKLESMANEFIKSDEFQAHYGSGLSNHDLVAKLYENVLHRSADQAGLDFWTGALDSHAATGAQVLAAISESRENIDGTAALIGNGLVLDQPLMA